MTWSFVIGSMVILALIITRFWPQIDAIRKRRQAAYELFDRLVKTPEQKDAASKNTPQKRATDAFGWGLRMGVTVIILAITGWGIHALLPNRVTGLIFDSGKPSAMSASVDGKQTWDPYDTMVTCPIKWNAEENGPWCYVIELPAGSYRIMPQSNRMWQQAIVGADGEVHHHNIPARGVLLRSIWNPPDRPYRDFLRMAPLGGNEWFGRLIARVGEKMMYDPYDHGWFTVTEPTKVVIGPNLPPLEGYVAMNIGEISFDIERLRQ